MPDLIIFDCDGVLVDTEPVAHTVISRYVAESGFELSAAESIRRFLGFSVSALCETLMREGARIPDDSVDEIRKRILAELATGVEPIPGIHDALATIPHQRCVASSGRHVKIRQSLQLAGLSSFFGENIFSAEDVAHPKPAPDLFLHAAEQMDADPEQTLVVEDSPVGIRAAVAAGMTVVAYANPEHSMDQPHPKSFGADHVILHMGDLPALLNQLERNP